MTIKDFTEMYYPTKKEMEMDALGRFIKEQCGKDYTHILNVLYRNEIRSIKDLYEIREERLSYIRNNYVGQKSYKNLLNAKKVIDDSLNISEGE